MNRDEVEWVREAFASGRATKLRLATGHTIYDCGEAAGISGEAWWKFEQGQIITAHRAPILGAVLRRMRNGEHLAAGDGGAGDSGAGGGAGGGADGGAAGGVGGSGAPPESQAAVAERARREHELLVAAMDFMSLSSADLVASAPTWESEDAREMRAAVRRLLRRRISELGVEPPNERLP